MSILPRWKPRAPGHSFELALPGEVPAVTADEQMLAHALDLMLAASVALAPAGGNVRVEIRPLTDAIVIGVRCQGPSLHDDELAALFAPFARLPRLGIMMPTGGSGLAIARTGLRLHGGSLRAERLTEASGTVLVAVCPLVPPPAEAMVTRSPLVLQESRAPGHLSPLHAARSQPVVLVYERDTRMGRYLRANFEAQQYHVHIASFIDELHRLIDMEAPDLIVIATAADTDACGMVGRLTSVCDAPLVVLAHRYDAENCVSLLEAGAIDYLAKPFSMEELLARVRVALRTSQSRERAQDRESVFYSGDLAIDFRQHRVTVGGQVVALSRTEYKLLRVLAQHAGMVLSHETLLERVWGQEYCHEVSFIWVYIRRLRTKIEADPAAPRYILTVAGVGYRLARV